MEDYYEVLGLPEDANLDELRRAYRRRALETHTDKNSSPEAPEQFRKATTAYKALFRLITHRLSAEKVNRTLKRGTDVLVVLPVKLDDLINNSEKLLQTTRRGLCKDCSGTGSTSKKTKRCQYCSGSGVQGISKILGQKKNCPLCEGAGILPMGSKCNRCSGTGTETEKITKKIRLNPYSNRVVLHGSGNYCYGGLPGNLIIDVRTSKHPRFTARGLNISGTVTISPVKAVIGGHVNMDVFDKKFKLTIPSGTQNGETLEKPGMGSSFGGKVGLFKAKIKIEVPLFVSKEERDHYEQILIIEEKEPCPSL